MATPEELVEWYQLKQQLAEVKEREMELRKKIFASFFPEPIEGTNKSPLSDGYVLKATHSIDRKVDDATFQNIKAELLNRGIAVDSVVKYKPELSISAYRLLTEEQVKFFDQCLIIKPGSPQLDVVKPKKG